MKTEKEKEAIDVTGGFKDWMMKRILRICKVEIPCPFTWPGYMGLFIRALPQHVSGRQNGKVFQICLHLHQLAWLDSFYYFLYRKKHTQTTYTIKIITESIALALFFLFFFKLFFSVLFIKD